MKLKMALAVLSVTVITLTELSAQEAAKEKLFEPARFWSAIANDDKLDRWRRGIAIYFLHERHLTNGITLEKMGEILDNPTWIVAEDVQKISFVDGALPLKRTPGDTIIRILVFDGFRNERFAIYLNVSGKINANSFLAVIKDRQGSEFSNREVKEMVMSPRWNEYVKKLPRRTTP